MDYALIMAGGSGTRLWPLSREALPKQALKLVGERSMFQHAVDRLAPDFPPERILVATRPEYARLLSEQIAEIPTQNYLLEPQGRGTAPAIGLAAAHLRRRDPEAVMVVLAADHFIADAARFRQSLSAARRVALSGALVTLGITPDRPACGYGYIQKGESLGQVDGFAVYTAAHFTEKPDPDTAGRMVSSGRYVWNSGMFIWKVSRIMDEFARHMPELYRLLQRIEAAIQTPDYEQVLQAVWSQAPVETIDYGVMEPAENVAVIPVEFGWTDVGSWSSVAELYSADSCGNVLVGPCVQIDTQNTLVYGGRRLVAAIGLKEMIIVDTEDALLICPKEREQDVRAIVKLLKAGPYRRWA